MLRTTIIAALALTATPTSVLAQTAQPLTVRVRTADLDLSRKAGVAELDRRISKAVEKLCPYRVTPDLPTLLAHRACMRAAGRSAADSRDHVVARSRSSAPEVAVAAW